MSFFVLHHQAPPSAYPGGTAGDAFTRNALKIRTRPRARLAGSGPASSLGALAKPALRSLRGCGRDARGPAP